VAVGVEGEGGQWTYPEGGASRPLPAGELQLVVPDRKGAIRVVLGELAGQDGELVGTDGGDAIVKLGSDIKIVSLSLIGWRK
jgi:hypothetical protein